MLINKIGAAAGIIMLLVGMTAQNIYSEVFGGFIAIINILLLTK